MQRLDKVLSEAGVASRRELKGIIRAGRVTVNGQAVRMPEQKVDAAADTILVDGQPIARPGVVGSQGQLNIPVILAKQLGEHLCPAHDVLLGIGTVGHAKPLGR